MPERKMNIIDINHFALAIILFLELLQNGKLCDQLVGSFSFYSLSLLKYAKNFQMCHKSF